MRALISLFLVLNFVFSPVVALAHKKHAKYYFDGDLKTEVVMHDENILRLEVIDNSGEDYAYPIGTLFTGHFLSHKNRRFFSLDEVEKFELETARLPDGEVVRLKNKRLKIKADGRFDGAYQFGRSTLSTAGFILSIAVDSLFLGIPVGRGGFALFYTLSALTEAPKCVNKVVEGFKGFLRGALYPLPQILGKGDKLVVHEKSTIMIGHDPYHNVYAKLKRFIGSLLLRDKEKYISAKLIIKTNQDFYDCLDLEEIEADL